MMIPHVLLDDNCSLSTSIGPFIIYVSNSFGREFCISRSKQRKSYYSCCNYRNRSDSLWDDTEILLNFNNHIDIK